ncbi:MAG TPA: hypothetical protein VFV34_17620, partial [Blastocatellia bacterium]|nr:hypothetical protein [Blastocatellia bacterium]
MFLSAGALVLLLAFQSGSSNPNSKPKPIQPSDRAAQEEQDGPNLPPEMSARLAIERAEGEHRKILETANQVGDLTAEIRQRYSERGNLNSDDLKKLGTVEKLAKRILDHSGGELVSDNEGKPEQISLATALEQLSTAGANVKKNICANTRFVVSASIIADSNEIIHLAQLIRH